MITVAFNDPFFYISKDTVYWIEKRGSEEYLYGPIRCNWENDKKGMVIIAPWGFTTWED